jgi:hypothetical protein
VCKDPVVMGSHQKGREGFLTLNCDKQYSVFATRGFVCNKLLFLCLSRERFSKFVFITVSTVPKWVCNSAQRLVMIGVPTKSPFTVNEGFGPAAKLLQTGVVFCAVLLLTYDG